MLKRDNIKHIFFDLDNTLWDHRGNSEFTLNQMFKDYDVENKFKIKFDPWHDVFYEKNENLWAELREGNIDKKTLRERRFSDPFKHFGIHNDEMSFTFEDNYLKKMGKMKGIVPNADKLLKYLYPNYKIHVITNGFEEVSHDKLINSGLDKYITTLTCADEIGVRKPDKRLFDLASSKAEAPRDQSVIVGDDWIADVLGGLDYGWQPIFFDSLNEEFEKDNVPVVKDLIEIKDLL